MTECTVDTNYAVSRLPSKVQAMWLSTFVASSTETSLPVIQHFRLNL